MSAKKIFGMAWEDFKKNWVFLVLALIVVSIISEGVRYASGLLIPIDRTMAATEMIVKTLISGIIGMIISMFFYGWLTKETLNVVDGKKTDWNIFEWGGNFGESSKRSLNMFLYYIIFMVPVFLFFAVAFGLIATIATSGMSIIIIWSILAIAVIIYLVYFGIYSGFAYFLLVENRMGVIDSIKKSISMVKKHKSIVWSFYSRIIGYAILFGILFGILSAFINGRMYFTGIFSLIFFVFVSGIITLWISIAMSHLYRQIDSDVKVNNIEEEMKEL